jgi:hypothetical protein
MHCTFLCLPSSKTHAPRCLQTSKCILATAEVRCRWLAETSSCFSAGIGMHCCCRQGSLNSILLLCAAVMPFQSTQRRVVLNIWQAVLILGTTGTCPVWPTPGWCPYAPGTASTSGVGLHVSCSTTSDGV